MAALILVLTAVVVRRPWPWAAWTLALAGGLIQVADGLAGLVALAGVVLVLYSVTAYGPRLMLPLSLSYDHRVIDGAAAARFVVYLGKLLGDLRRVLL